MIIIYRRRLASRFVASISNVWCGRSSLRRRSRMLAIYCSWINHRTAEYQRPGSNSSTSCAITRKSRVSLPSSLLDESILSFLFLLSLNFFPPSSPRNCSRRESKLCLTWKFYYYYYYIFFFLARKFFDFWDPLNFEERKWEEISSIENFLEFEKMSRILRWILLIV